jgi:hypothetical protein
MRKGLAPALICGLVLSGACLVSAGVDYVLATSSFHCIAGVVAGLFTMSLAHPLR